MTSLQSATQKIVERVPEIVELKFGCRVRIDGALNNEIVYVYPPSPDEEKCVRLADNSQFAISDLEIIGRPIRLADVLLAIGECSTDKEVCVGKDGSFCVNDGPKIAYWNLRNDDLSAQSPECIAFIDGLL